MILERLPWILLGIAGCLEVIWALAMKSSDGFTRLGPTVLMVLSLVGSLSLLAVAMRNLPVGTSYMVWAGIGAIGTFLAGIVLLGEAANPVRLLAGAFVLVGIVLFKVGG